MSNDWAGTNLTSWGKTAVTGAYGTKTAATCTVFSSDIDTRFPENASVEPEIQVSLHPFLKGVVTIELRGLAGATMVKIIGLNGKLIQQQTSADRVIHLSTQGDPGVYLVKVSNAQRTFAQKIFVR